MAHLEERRGAATLAVPAHPTLRQTPPDVTEAPSRRVGSEWALYALIAALVGGAWWIVQQGWFKAGDDVGYWLGVAGGIAMLTLFSYPLRKYVRRMHRWGKVKWWFWVHMTLGIAGPLLILVHSTFRVGSTNAAVALYSMLIVAGSGVVGRFLYVRVNRGLHSEVETLRQLQNRAGLDQTEVRSRLAFAPGVEARLLAFEQQHVGDQRSLGAHFRQVLLLPLLELREYALCCAELRQPLAKVAASRRWSADDLAKRQRQARRLVRRYLRGVARVALFSSYVRLFALWHIAHVPFVYIMVISAVAHVVAVHAY
jgi:hypothetical protein